MSLIGLLNIPAQVKKYIYKLLVDQAREHNHNVEDVYLIMAQEGGDLVIHVWSTILNRSLGTLNDKDVERILTK